MYPHVLPHTMHPFQTPAIMFPGSSQPTICPRQESGKRPEDPHRKTITIRFEAISWPVDSGVSVCWINYRKGARAWKDRRYWGRPKEAGQAHKSTGVRVEQLCSSCILNATFKTVWFFCRSWICPSAYVQMAVLVLRRLLGPVLSSNDLTCGQLTWCHYQKCHFYVNLMFRKISWTTKIYTSE